MVRQISCILSINGNIQKANCNMQTAEFSTVRESGCYFFTCCKGWRAFKVVAHLLRKDKTKQSRCYFPTTNICYLYYLVKVTKRFSTLFFLLLYSTPNIHVLVQLHQT